MAVKLVLDTLDGVDDALRPLYVEHDGKFHLDADAESIRGHRDVTPLANAYDRTKADRDKIKAALADAERKAGSIPADFDPEAWKSFKEGKTDAAAMVKLRQELEADRDKWKGQYEATVAQVRRVTIDQALADAIAKAGITNPAYAKAARALLSPQVKLDGDSPTVDTDMGPLALGDFVKRWASGEDGKAFVTPPKGDAARGNDRGAGAGKTVSAKDLDKMTAQEKAKFFAANPGTVVTD